MYKRIIANVVDAVAVLLGFKPYAYPKRHYDSSGQSLDPLPDGKFILTECGVVMPSRRLYVALMPNLWRQK